jgi:pyruvate dehydrogenase E1 component beta subunit
VNEAIRLEMRSDPTVVLFGEDVAGGATLPHMEGENKEAWGGVLAVTKGLAPEFGRNRVLDTPISESAFIGSAIGAAATGLRPIAELMFVDFLGVCFDQIFNQGAKLRYMFGGKAQVPVVIRTMIGAGFRAAAQHSECLYSIFTHIPGLKTVVPSTPYDAKGLLSSAIRDNDPVIFFEHKLLYDMEGEVPEDNYTIPLGKAEVKREGKDATIITVGRMVHFSLEAAEKLADDGLDVEVVDLRSLSPMDTDAILESVKKTHRLVVVDEDFPRCSIATDVVALVAGQAFDYLDAPCKMITAPHTHVPFSPALEDVYIPSVDTIVKTVKSLKG